MISEKEYYETVPFECPITGNLIKGVYFPTLNEVKFKFNYKRNEGDWDTLEWCITNSKRGIRGLEAANIYIDSLGLGTNEIFFK